MNLKGFLLNLNRLGEIKGLVPKKAELYLIYLRRGRDLNPRYLAVHKLSKLARSATLTPLRLVFGIANVRKLYCIKQLSSNNIIDFLKFTGIWNTLSFVW